jgi:hypothetical protein
MLKTMVIAISFVAGILTPVGQASAQTCCVCTDCITTEQARCFADIDDTLCADFCAAQECDERELVGGGCFAPLCEGFPIAEQTAPALGYLGIALAALAACFAGMGRILRRNR